MTNITITATVITASLVLFVFAMTVRPIRKAVGLLLIILGVFECLSLFGLLVGIPSIVLGGVFLFS